MFSDQEYEAIEYFRKKKFKETVQALKTVKPKHISVSRADAEDIAKAKFLYLVMAWCHQQLKDQSNARIYYKAFTTLVNEQFVYKSTKPHLLDSDMIYDSAFEEELYLTGHDTAIIGEWLKGFSPSAKLYSKAEINKEAIAEELIKWGEFYGILFLNRPIAPLSSEIKESLSAAKQKAAYKISISYFDKALTFGHNKGEVYYAKAKQVSKKNPAEGFKLYELALKHNPNHAGALFELQAALAEDERYEDEFLAYTERYLDVVDKCDKLFIKSPDYMNYFRCGGFDVQYAYERVAKGNFEKGTVLLYEKKKYAEAEERLLKCIELMPKLGSRFDNFEDPWIAMADVYYFQYDYKKALQWADKALKVYSGSIKGSCAKGAAFLGLKQYKKAMDCFEKAEADYKEMLEEWEYTPEDYFFYYYGKACVLANTKGNHSEIFKLLKKAIALHPPLKKELRTDEFLEPLWTDAQFKKLTA